MNNGKKTGSSFLGLLTLIFITLKLLDKIEWSWIWVLSPIWLPIGIVLLIAIIYATITE